MEEFSVTFKIVSERNCPFYAADDLLVLTGQAVQLPPGHPSCLILVREMTNLLFSTIVPAVATGFDELKSSMFNCGGCTGLIKFAIEESPEDIFSGEDAVSAGNAADNLDHEDLNGIVVSGQISEISPSELMQFFHMHQKTGNLVFDVISGSGRVIFREGAVIGAKFMDQEDKDAVFTLLREHKGRFSFVNGISQELLEVEEIGDFMMLLMEGIKRMDEDPR